MVIVEVKAKFACDDCGTEFWFSLDPAYVPPASWSVFDIAVDRIKAGIDYHDATDDTRLGVGSADSDGRHYCSRCTRKRDAQETPQ